MKTIDSNFLLNNKGLLAHRKCVFVVGAGISVASGIPDFRSPTGIFASLREQLKISGKQLFTYNFGVKEGSRQVYLSYISALKRLCDTAAPNPTHHFLANFPRSRLYTQNIDGLEERAGMVFSKKDTTKGVYLHGNLACLACQYCGFKREFSEEDMRVFEGGSEMACSECEERSRRSVGNGQRRRPIGVMHPGIIHYQQVHPEGAFIGRMCERDMDSDLVIVMGTSLAVDGVKKLVRAFCRNGTSEGKRILVNLTKPNKEWTSYFDYFYEGDCGEFVRVAEEIMRMRGGKAGETSMESKACVTSEISKANEMTKASERCEISEISKPLDVAKPLDVITLSDMTKENVKSTLEHPADEDEFNVKETSKADMSDSTVEADSTTMKQETSFCAGLEDEIEKIVSEGFREESGRS